MLRDADHQRDQIGPGEAAIVVFAVPEVDPLRAVLVGRQPRLKPPWAERSHSPVIRSMLAGAIVSW